MTLHRLRYPNESEEYRRARDELLRAEIDLRRRIEEVAELRRKLPLGGELKEDYSFEEVERGSGKKRTVKLSELFGDKNTLLLYHYMFGADWDEPCPMCTSLLDGHHGALPALRERCAFAVVARAPEQKLRQWADERGWKHHRILSSGQCNYSPDYLGERESKSGDQHPVMNVFTRKANRIYHFWGSELLFLHEGEGEPRHLDLTWPLWNLLDLTPEGRGGDWHPKLRY
jgi:predicted dithiol-disulfide oxidoreductase (DUF899 family)